jgi:CheY-like chemotaxis protein
MVNQKLAVGVLTRCGQQVTVANNGQEAVDLTAGQDFDLVLMDIQMPELDGLEATRLIRQRERGTGKRVPIIAMTAHALTGDRERCLKYGMDEYLSKPVRPLELMEKIATITGKALIASHESVPVEGVAEPAANDEIRPEPLVNWPYALESAGGDEQLLCELIDAYFIERPRLMAEIDQALLHENHELLHRAAHTIKGALRLFGYTRGQQVAFELEKLGQQRSSSGGYKLRDELTALIDQFEPELHIWLRQHRVVA